MKIIDILDTKNMSLSFEVFPPKKESTFESVVAATEEIAACHPAFMSVTYGAGGGTSRYTMEIAKNIKDKYNVPTLAHLTCVSSSRNMVHQKIQEMKEMGIVNVMALRGDLTPELEKTDPSTWDYKHATELVRELKEAGDFCVGAACYPEVHPDSVNQKDDLTHIKEKVEAGADFLTTQMVFDNNLFFNFMYKIREIGVTVPIIPGIMPITNANQVSRMVDLSNAYIPRKLLAICDRFRDSPEAMMQAGIAYATDQIIDLISNGVRGIHIYTMNKPEIAGAIIKNVDQIIKATNE